MNASRRGFLAAGLALPAAASQSASPSAAPAGAARKLPPDLNSPLRYRTLGRTGLKVTSVGFGCMITSDGTVVERAADMGINYFDTARGYQNGNNERMVGAALKSQRKNIVLSTKTHARTRVEALKDIETSLKELGTDYVDIWYLHALSKPEQVTMELIEAQQIAKRQGKIRFAGVSTHGGHNDLLPELASNGLIDVVLTSYNFTMDPKMNELIEQVARSGQGVVAMKVMAGGFRRVKPGEKLHTTLKQDGAFVSALKWTLRNPNVHTTIPSITDADQLEEDMKAMTAGFDKQDEKLLAEVIRHSAGRHCFICNRCEGTCSKGLPVADVMRTLTYAEGYGQFALGRERFSELGASPECGGCAACSVECPYGVKVSRDIVRARDLFA